MPAPNLPALLKRLAMTQMGIAHHFAHPNLYDDSARFDLLNESRYIVADLQTFIDTHKIEVTPRIAGTAQQCRECGAWH